MQLTHQRLVGLAAGGLEAIEVTIRREASHLELMGGGANRTLGELRFQKLRQDRTGGCKGWRSLLVQLAHGMGHAMHVQTPKHDHDGAKCGAIDSSLSKAEGDSLFNEIKDRGSKGILAPIMVEWAHES